MRFATQLGMFSVMIYQGIDKPFSKGVHARIHFFPTLAQQGDRVALIQACNAMQQDETGEWHRYLTSAAGDERVSNDDWFIDAGGSNNPAFGLSNAHSQGPERIKIENGRGSGFAGSDGKIGAWDGGLDSAYLDDKPTRPPVHGRNVRHHFESVAMCASGPNKGTCFGSIRWGYDIGAEGELKLLKPSAANIFTEEWRGAAVLWNGGPGLKIPGV